MKKTRRRKSLSCRVTVQGDGDFSESKEGGGEGGGVKAFLNFLVSSVEVV